MLLWYYRVTNYNLFYSPVVDDGNRDGAAMSPQSHHISGVLLHKQHRAVTLTPLYVLKIHGRLTKFTTAEHILFPHCSVVFMQFSVLRSKSCIYRHVLSSN